MGHVGHLAGGRILAFVIQAFGHFKNGTCEPFVHATGFDMKSGTIGTSSGCGG